MTLIRYAPPGSMLSTRDESVEWHVTKTLVPYQDALEEMDRHSHLIHSGKRRERVWLLEHPPLYTAGTSAQDHELLDTGRFPVFRSGRGGKYTYHGPGQRVAYVMLDLNRRQRDVRRFIATIEDWIINSLAHFGIEGKRSEDRVGIWVDRPGDRSRTQDKIAAIGVRIRRWITQHGLSINIHPELGHFSGILPCGIQRHGITSMRNLGVLCSMDGFDCVLRTEFEKHFGPTTVTIPPHHTNDP